MSNPLSFQPTLLGIPIQFESGERDMITDESETQIYIESSFFTGWMDKATYWELSGIEE